MSEFSSPASQGFDSGEYLSFAMPPADWEKAAACDGTDPEMFEVTAKGSPDPLRIADKFCAVCPVTFECLAEDILRGVTARTVRGGVIRSERKRMADAYENDVKYHPTKKQGQYRNVGFVTQMKTWREGIVDAIQTKEVLLYTIEKQISAGTVIPDSYYQKLADDLQDLRRQLNYVNRVEDSR